MRNGYIQAMRKELYAHLNREGHREYNDLPYFLKDQITETAYVCSFTERKLEALRNHQRGLFNKKLQSLVKGDEDFVRIEWV